MAMTPSRFPVGALLCALGLLAPAAPARAEDSADRIAVEARFAPEGKAAPGGTARLEVKLTVDPGWHVYGPGDPFPDQAVALKVSGGAEGLSFGPFEPDRPPEAVKGEFDDQARMEYEGTVTFVATAKVPADAEPGERKVSGTVEVMACDAEKCLGPGKVEWTAKVVIGKGEAEAPAPRLPTSADRVKVTAAAVEGRPALAVTIAIDDGWHVYGPGDFYKQDTKVRITKAPEGVTFGEFTPDRDPTPRKDEFDDGPRMEFKGTVVYTAEFPPVLGTGTFDVEGEVVLYACTEEGCLPEGTVPFAATLPWPTKANLKVEGVPPVVAAPDPPIAAPSPDDPGITLGFLLTAVIGGLLTIVTPCVFPMIPLTVSLLTKRAEREPGKVVSSALAYGAGMFASLVGVGLFVTLVLGVAPTDIALSPWFNLGIFAFLVYLALSLFGAYDIQLPAFLTNWSQSKAGTGGAAGLFFMGMTLAFTSFACAAPIAGLLFVQAKTDIVKGVVGMSVYAGAFTAPFFVTALFPGMLKRLPRSGGWLNAVKVVLGFVEVAAAFKFLRGAGQVWDWPFFSFELVIAVWIACAFGAALYLFGFLVLPHDARVEHLGVGRLLWALAFLSGGLVLLPGLWGGEVPRYVEAFILRDLDASVAVPNGAPGGRKGTESGLRWIRNDLDAAMAEARETGKPVFIDFTGFG